MSGIDEVFNEEKCHKHGEEYPRERGKMRYSREACGASHIVDVHDNDADDFTEAQGCDGEIVTVQAECRKADKAAQKCRRSAACQHAHDKGHVEIRGQDNADIAAHRHESRVSQ